VKTTRSSKSRENRQSWRAQANSTTVRPCSGHSSFGALRRRARSWQSRCRCDAISVARRRCRTTGRWRHTFRSSRGSVLLTHRDHELWPCSLVAELRPADHHRGTEPEHLGEYASDARAFLLSDFQPRQPETVGRRRRVAADGQSGTGNLTAQIEAFGRVADSMVRRLAGLCTEERAEVEEASRLLRRTRAARLIPVVAS
jgi:hypothetical protein